LNPLERRRKQLQRRRLGLVVYNDEIADQLWRDIMAKEQRSTKEKRKPKKAAADKKDAKK
jgi:hypothetical protein